MVRSSDTAHLLMSEPIRVLFAGMESDTYTMTHAGWRIAMDEGPGLIRHDNVSRVVLHHPALQLSLTGVMHSWRGLWEERRQAATGRHLGGYMELARIAHIEIVSAGQRGNVYLPPPVFARMSVRDGIPRMVEVEHQQLSKLPLFAQLDAPPVDTVELITDPAYVQTLLDQIMSIQAPIRKEIRARDAQRERAATPEGRQVYANIVSLQAA